MIAVKNKLARCPWATNELSIKYHDEEWGVPVHDDRRWFEFLILEGAQAGLSWDTILQKRDGYREAFGGFDPAKVARFSDRDIRKLLRNPEIVRNRLKIRATVANAQAFLWVQKQHGSFDAYVWKFVGSAPIQNRWRIPKQVPAKTEVSVRLSRDLLKRGFRFVGPTICYALMQATGLVNDHLVTCYRYRQLQA